MWELLCFGSRALHENFSHVNSSFFVCMSCGDLYAYMGITSAVFRCEYAPCSGVSPSKHQTQSQDKRRRWSTQKLQANKQYQPVWMSGTNINQFECLAPVSSSMMARLITTCTCTIIHGKKILNHYNKSSMTGNSCCKRLVVFWSCRSADVVACADCPRPTCRATGCKICEKPRLFHWKVGMAALRKGGWDRNRKMCFKLCLIFSSFKWFMGLNLRNLAKCPQFPLQNHVSSIFWTS